MLSVDDKTERSSDPQGRNEAVVSVPVVGKWYYLEYGYDVVLGRCVAVGNGRAMYSFRWGSPFRTTQMACHNRLVAEGKDPRLLTKFIRLLAR